MPGRRNFMHSQCVASPIEPTMRMHSCSSTFLTARASIIGVMPSTQLIFLSLKTSPGRSSASTSSTALHLVKDRVGELLDLLLRGRTGCAFDPGIGVADVLLR